MLSRGLRTLNNAHSSCVPFAGIFSSLVAHFAPRRAQMLLGLVFAGIGADLDQPAATGAGLRRRFGLCLLSFGRLSFGRFGFGGLGAGRRSGRDLRLGDFGLGDFRLGDVRLGGLLLDGIGLDRSARDRRHSVGRGNDRAWCLRLRRSSRHQRRHRRQRGRLHRRDPVGDGLHQQRLDRIVRTGGSARGRRCGRRRVSA